MGWVLILFFSCTPAFRENFEPSVQPVEDLQYFKPQEEKYFAGDPMPFFHEGIFHVYWLLDYNHVPAGHVWAHFSTADLQHWTHHPLALTITLPFEKSICTGSVIFHNGLYYAFYATRTQDSGRTEFVSYAKSSDGISFIKQQPNPLIIAPQEYESAHFRDPHVFYDDSSKKFHMLITTALQKADLEKNRYCLLRYTSKDLIHWTCQGPFYYTGSDKGFAYPECSDLFKWNGWYYLLFKIYGGTYYRMSHSLNGPFVAPPSDNLSNDYAMVLKTAPFGEQRRIAVGFIPSRAGNKDDGQWTYGGNLVFRELVQKADGTLAAVFCEEMMPAVDSGFHYEVQEEYCVDSPDRFAYYALKNVPVNARIRMKVVPMGPNTSTGMLLRYSERGFYELSFDAAANKVNLGNTSIERVKGLDVPFEVDVVMKHDIIDVCIDRRRCILNRCPEQKGNQLLLFVHNGKVSFKNLIIEKLKE